MFIIEYGGDNKIRIHTSPISFKHVFVCCLLLEVGIT